MSHKYAYNTVVLQQQCPYIQPAFLMNHEIQHLVWRLFIWPHVLCRIWRWNTAGGRVPSSLSWGRRSRSWTRSSTCTWWPGCRRWLDLSSRCRWGRICKNTDMYTPDGTFSRPFGFISNLRLVKSPQKEFIKRRQHLNGDWTNLLSVRYKSDWSDLFLPVEPDSCSSRPPDSVRQTHVPGKMWCAVVY